LAGFGAGSVRLEDHHWTAASTASASSHGCVRSNRSNRRTCCSSAPFAARNRGASPTSFSRESRGGSSDPDRCKIATARPLSIARLAEDQGSRCLRRVVSVPHAYQKCAGERPGIRTGEPVLLLLNQSALCDCEV